MGHQSFGRMTPVQIKELADAPFGQAAKSIREIDPLWGVEEGRPIKWRAKFSREVREVGSAIVEAATKEEAEELAEALPEASIRSDDIDALDEWELESVEPAR